ncbi:MAG: redoxin family protein [Polyangiaceae bacterium]
MRSAFIERSSAFVLPLLLPAIAALSGCGGSDTGSSGSGGTTTTTTTETTTETLTGGAGGATDTGGTGGVTDTTPKPEALKTLKGDVTWNVTFDDAAKATGATDCSYTRHYEATEDRSAPWLCPTCEVMFRADVTVTDGLDTCYKQVSSSMPSKTEWIGWSNGKYFRSPMGPTSEQGTAVVNGSTVDIANQVLMQPLMAGGNLDFNVSGQMTIGEIMGDPQNGFNPPGTYACGWPKANPPAYTGDYVLAKGAVVPDGVFLDKCNEPVRIHDFKGTYLVIDMSAIDCPPCQQMATEEEAFVTAMKAKGIDVQVITLLAPSLSDVFGVTSQAKLTTWTTKYKLESPVLNDRGWGVAEFEPAIGADNIGYPSWVVVRPDLTVIDFMTGYGGWSEMQTRIETDAMP